MDLFPSFYKKQEVAKKKKKKEGWKNVDIRLSRSKD